MATTELSGEPRTDLIKLCEIGTERIERFIELVESSETGHSPNKLLALATEVIEDRAQAHSLVRAATGLYWTSRSQGTDARKVATSVRRAAERLPDVEELNWDSFEQALSRLIALPLVRFETKALELKYDYARILREAHIVTDVRPIFDDSGDEIDGAVISHTLRLTISSAEGDSDMSIALDKNDIDSLMAQCVRALKKATIAREFMADKGIPTVVTGEDPE